MKFKITQTLLTAGFMICIASCNNQPNTASSTNTDSATAEKKYSGPTDKDVYEVINTGNWAKLDALIGKDGIDHSSMGDIRGLDSIKAELKQLRMAFPDIKLEAMEEAMQGDMIFTRYRFTGTNTGSMNGMPATNKKVDMVGVDVSLVKDGKLQEHWDYSDNLKLFQQLGIDPLAKKPSSKK